MIGNLLENLYKTTFSSGYYHHPKELLLFVLRKNLEFTKSQTLLFQDSKLILQYLQKLSRTIHLVILLKELIPVFKS